MTVEKALAELRAGRPILLYDSDGREAETDIVYASEAVTPDAIRRLRKDAGGLICTAVGPSHHQKLGLPFLADLLAGMSAKHPVLAEMRANDIRYDASPSSFGLTINARATFTGIPDADRALTIRALADFLQATAHRPTADVQQAFGAKFRAPGHVILLNGAEGGLTKRQGHTELSLALVEIGGMVASTTICEMLDDATGKALPKKAASDYAKANGLVFLTGTDVMAAWKNHLKEKSLATPAHAKVARKPALDLTSAS